MSSQQKVSWYDKGYVDHFRALLLEAVKVAERERDEALTALAAMEDDRNEWRAKAQASRWYLGWLR